MEWPSPSQPRTKRRITRPQEAITYLKKNQTCIYH